MAASKEKVEQECYNFYISVNPRTYIFGRKYIIKVNLVAKYHAKCVCVIFLVKLKKLPFLAVLAWFLILGKIQDGSQGGDNCEVYMK